VSRARRGVVEARARAGFNGTPGREGAIEGGLRLLAMMAYCYEEGTGRFVCTNVVRHDPIISTTAISLWLSAGTWSCMCRIRDRLLRTWNSSVKRRLPWWSRLDDVQVLEQSPDDAPAHQRPASLNFLSPRSIYLSFVLLYFRAFPTFATVSRLRRQLFGCFPLLASINALPSGDCHQMCNPTNHGWLRPP
jgi:hypothetical protein